MSRRRAPGRNESRTQGDIQVEKPPRPVGFLFQLGFSTLFKLSTTSVWQATVTFCLLIATSYCHRLSQVSLLQMTVIYPLSWCSAFNGVIGSNVQIPMIAAILDVLQTLILTFYVVLSIFFYYLFLTFKIECSRVEKTKKLKIKNKSQSLSSFYRYDKTKPC